MCVRQMSSYVFTRNRSCVALANDIINLNRNNNNNNKNDEEDNHINNNNNNIRKNTT